MKFVVLPFLFLFSVSLFAQSVDYEQIDEYLQKTQENWELPGMAVGIVKDGELVFSKGYGELKTKDGETPNEHTNYAIASNSKAFTTALLAMLVQEGKLDWNDKVQDYLPYFELYDPYISQMITIEDLLTHRVGLGTFSGDVMWYDSDLSTEQIVRRAKYISQVFELRDGFGYSNVMYITAGDLIEKVTGKSWCENVTERIFKPLGMDRSVCSLTDLFKMKNVATPHATIDGVDTEIRWENWDNVASTGGIISNVDDLSKWLIFNMNHGVIGKDTLLSTESRNKIWTPHNNFTVNHTGDKQDANFRGYGLGFVLGEYKNNFQVSHTGGYGGMLSSITMLPDENLGIIFLSNDTESPLRAVPNYIQDRFIDPNTEVDYASMDRTSFLNRKANDNRVQQYQEARVKNTKPSKKLKQYAGNYYSDLYGGNLIVDAKRGQLTLTFEHSPHLSATLTPWHYDTFEIHWNEIQPWFDFGLVQFIMDSNQSITGLEINVPNDDFFFEELEPYRTE